MPEDSHDGDQIRVEGMGNAGTNGRESGDFVCEVRVAEERLTPQQQSGMRLAGVGIPILVMGLANASGSRVTAIVGAVMVAVGLGMAVRDGIRTNLRWWRQAGTEIVGGAVSGVVVALLLSFLVSGFFLYPMTFLILLFLFMSLASRRSS